MAENLTQRTFAGLRWTYLSVGASALLQLGYTAVMGRLLPPAAFGLVAMAMVFLAFGEHFARLGVGPALIQKPDLTDRDVRTGFTSSVLLGTAFLGLLALLAPVAGGLYDDPEVVPIVRLLALNFLLHGAGLVATHLLRREMRFKALAMVDVGAYTVGYLAIGITMAVAGAGVWSLVGAALGQNATKTLLVLVLSRHPMRPLLAGAELRRLYGYGSRITIIGFFEYLTSALPTYAVGRYAGQTSLGLMNRADLIVTLPFSHATTGLGKVLLPTFSTVQSDATRLRRGYFSAITVAASILIPMGAGIAVAAPELIRLLLGPQWDAAAPLVPFLAIAGVCAVLSQFGGILCDATATLNRKLLLQVTFIVVLAGGLMASSGQELVVYTVVIGLSELFRHAMYIALVGRITGIGYLEHVAAYVRPLLTGAAVAGSIAGVTAVLHGIPVPLPLVVGAQVGTGATVLALSILWGPMVPFKRQLHEQLTVAGVLNPVTTVGRVGARVLTLGR